MINVNSDNETPRTFAMNNSTTMTRTLMNRWTVGSRHVKRII